MLRAGLKRDFTPSHQAHRWLAYSGGKPKIDLHNLSARQIARIVHVEAHLKAAGGRRVRCQLWIRDRERRIGESVAKGEERLKLLRLVPLVSDIETLNRVIDIESPCGAGWNGYNWPRQLADACRKGDGQFAGGIDGAKEKIGNRSAALLAGIPRLQHRAHICQPWHDVRPAILQHDDGVWIGRGNGSN